MTEYLFEVFERFFVDEFNSDDERLVTQTKLSKSAALTQFDESKSTLLQEQRMRVHEHSHDKGNVRPCKILAEESRYL